MLGIVKTMGDKERGQIVARILSALVVDDPESSIVN